MAAHPQFGKNGILGKVIFGNEGAAHAFLLVNLL